LEKNLKNNVQYISRPLNSVTTTIIVLKASNKYGGDTTEVEYDGRASGNVHEGCVTVGTCFISNVFLYVAHLVPVREKVLDLKHKSILFRG
jgi:hypothetical protein